MKDNLAEIVKKTKAKAEYDPLEYIKEESKYVEVKNDNHKT